jgi:hypothetical protein
VTKTRHQRNRENGEDYSCSLFPCVSVVKDDDQASTTAAGQV